MESITSTSTTETSALSLHDALPIFGLGPQVIGVLLRFRLELCDFFFSLGPLGTGFPIRSGAHILGVFIGFGAQRADRKSTRLNSSHVAISYAVLSLKKKKDFGYAQY